MTGNDSPRVAVLGAGAVGCYFGGLLARSGIPVTLIGRPHHMDAIRRHGLHFEGMHFEERIAVATSTEIAAAGDAAIVLFCVKTTDTEDAARALGAVIAPGAIVVSMQNGVDNVERIRSAAGIEALPAVVYVAAAMASPGHVKHTGRGDLVVGTDAPASLAALFEKGGIPCKVSADIQAELWAKLTMNCVYNAISALSRSRYGPAVRNPWTRALMERIVAEVSAVAGALGIALETGALTVDALALGEAMAGATSSTAQDLARGKLTEIDALNGYVARRGEAAGVPAPINFALHALVKLLEESVRTSTAAPR
jgi:2-dehydropantoate 2-reductase